MNKTLRNSRLQTRKEKENCDSLAHKEKSLNNRFSRCMDKKKQADQRGESGKCNVCSAPCSSCFHNGKESVKPGDESSGENYTENTETGPSELCSMTGITSISDSLSDSALLKGSSRASNLSALDAGIPHSQSGCQRLPEVHDDCMSGASETEENAIKKSHLDDGIFNEKSTGECVEGTLQVTSLAGLHLVDTSLGPSPGNETMEEASNKNDDPQEKQKEDNSVGAKNENLRNPEEHIGMLSHTIAPADGDTLALPLISTEMKEDMPVETHHADENEDSDMVEQDVKVCDICGDAGREELLAICSQCSDGAEHTYCMREMLDKVPEGDWLCEECQNMEKVDSERVKKIGKVAENEKNISYGHTSGEYANDTDIVGEKRKDNLKFPSKRNRDDTDAEISSKLKKTAIESIVGSPRTPRPGMAVATAAPALTRTNSSRILEKSSAETIQVNEITESSSSALDYRQQKAQGSFLKSSSFNSLNSKPKVKLVDQAVIKRQKSVKEHASGHRNEDGFRSIGRSASFKSSNSVRSEPKVKMLSSRPSDIQVVKFSRQRTPFERQKSVKAEHSPITPQASSSKIDKRSAIGGESLSKIDKKSADGGESSSLIAVSCKQEAKPLQTEIATASLSSSYSFQFQKAVDPSTSAGDLRRPLLYANSSVGVSSGSGINKNDKRNSSLLNMDGGLPDGLNREGDSIDSNEQTKVYSGSHFARSSTKASKDETPNHRAASFKKPVTFLRNRHMGQSDASTITGTVCEVSSQQDIQADSSERKKVVSDTEQAEKTVVCQNYNADSVNNLKQSSVVTMKDNSSSGNHAAFSGDSSRDHLRNIPVTVTSFTKRMAFPEHECVWQGSFEVFWSGKSVKLINGIQAHLSSVASPKVIEAVNKFKSRIVLHEVPRVSSWPMQFRAHGVRDDNIALFFFAKDLESYNDVYKVTLDNMIKKDMAFKGSVDGVELLIFPSNLLPEVSQRWNMLFFLWGVFRAKRESCLQHNSESSTQVPAAYQVVPPKPRVSLLDDGCSTRPTSEASVQNQAVIGRLSEELPSLKVTNSLKSVEMSPDDVQEHKMNSTSEIEMPSASQGVVVTSQKERDSTQHSPPCGSTADSGVPQIPVKDVPFATELLRHPSRESTDVSRGADVDGATHPSVRLAVDAGVTPVNQMPTKKYDVFPRDLNVEPEVCLSDDDESEPPGTSELPLRFGSPLDDTCNPVRQVAAFDTERYFFPIKSSPTNVTSLAFGSPNSPKVLMSEQGDAFNQPPTLELALSTESIRSSQCSIWPAPLLSSSGEGKVTDGGGLGHEEASSDPGDVALSAASLSLSLSFPFP